MCSGFARVLSGGGLIGLVISGMVSLPSAARADLFVDPLFDSVKTASNQVYRADAPRVGGTTTALQYDVYQPSQASGGPAVPNRLPGMVLVHGGGFVQGSKTNGGIVQMAEYFSRRGYVVASINYRLMNLGDPLLDPAVEAGPYPVNPPQDPAEYLLWASNPFNFAERTGSAINAAHNDAAYFSNIFFQDAADYGVDPERIALAGSSAGAITSLAAGYADHPNGPNQDFGSVISLAGAMYGLEFLVDADDPALWFQHGTNDTTVPYSNAQALLARAEAVGLSHSFHTHDEGHSIFEPYFNNLTADGLTFAEDSTRFLYDQMQLNQLNSVPEPLGFPLLFGVLAASSLVRRGRSGRC